MKKIIVTENVLKINKAYGYATIEIIINQMVKNEMVFIDSIQVSSSSRRGLESDVSNFLKNKGLIKKTNESNNGYYHYKMYDEAKEYGYIIYVI